MKLDRHTIEREYRVSIEKRDKLVKASESASKLASDNKPDIRGYFTHKRAHDEEYKNYCAARDEWEKTYIIPAEKAARKANAEKLYCKALAELLNHAITRELVDRVASAEFIDRFDGVPIRYQRVRNALFAGFNSESYTLYPDNGYEHRILGRFWPDPEKLYSNYVDIEVWLPGYKKIFGDECFDRETLEYQKETDGVFRASDEWPSFAEIHKACVKAPAIKQKHADILETARKRADDLREANSCGLWALRQAIAD